MPVAKVAAVCTASADTRLSQRGWQVAFPSDRLAASLWDFRFGSSGTSSPPARAGPFPDIHSHDG